MATTEDQGLIFVITTGDVTLEKIKSAASRGVADCAAVRHSTCRIAASAALNFTNDGSGNLQRRAAEIANEILKAIAQIQAEKSTAIAPRLDFLGEVSREVRTPATIVAGYAGMLRDKLLGELTPEQESVVEKVLTEINDLMLTVTNIFEAERIDSTAGPLASHEVNTGALLGELRSIYNCFPNRTVRVVWDYPADLPIILSDANKLRLILQNLIHSSLKLSTHGQLTIAARYLCQAQVLQFVVATTGTAFPREMFEPSYQERHSGDSVKNWGIYLVHTCTKQLGGTITLESDGEKRSTVTVRLPVKETAVQPGFVRSEAVHGAA